MKGTQPVALARGQCSITTHCMSDKNHMLKSALWKGWIQISLNKSHKNLLIQQQQLRHNIISLKLNRTELILNKQIKKVYHLTALPRKINPQRHIKNLTQKIKFSRTSSAKYVTQI